MHKSKKNIQKKFKKLMQRECKYARIEIDSYISLSQCIAKVIPNVFPCKVFTLDRFFIRRDNSASRKIKVFP